MGWNLGTLVYGGKGAGEGTLCVREGRWGDGMGRIVDRRAAVIKAIWIDQSSGRVEKRETMDW